MVKTLGFVADAERLEVPVSSLVVIFKNFEPLEDLKRMRDGV